MPYRPLIRLSTDVYVRGGVSVSLGKVVTARGSNPSLISVIQTLTDAELAGTVGIAPTQQSFGDPLDTIPVIPKVVLGEGFDPSSDGYQPSVLATELPEDKMVVCERIARYTDFLNDHGQSFTDSDEGHKPKMTAYLL